MIAINRKTGEVFTDLPLRAAPNAAVPAPFQPTGALAPTAPKPRGLDALTPSQRRLIKKHGWDAETLYPEHFSADGPAPASAPLPSGRGEASIPESSKAMARRFGWDLRELYPEHFEGDDR